MERWKLLLAGKVGGTRETETGGGRGGLRHRPIAARFSYVPCQETKAWCQGGAHVPFVNRPIEAEIDGTVNFTNFSFVLVVTWRHRLRFLCHLRQNVVPRKVLKFDV